MDDTQGEASAADAPSRPPSRAMTRRRLLVGGGVVAGAATLGGLGIALEVLPGSDRIRRWFADTGPDGSIPDAPNGDVRLEQRTSIARGREVGVFTAVPDGYGDGAGLPVCLVLHGASATTADFERFGLGRFLTAAVAAGSPPFVLVGADGGRSSWAGSPGDDPQAMLREEVPVWCDERGFDTSRVAAYGWSMGGYGVLLTSLRHPGWLRRVAALSPAVGGRDEVSARAAEIAGDRTGIWCGTADALHDAVRELVEDIPGGPAIAAFDAGDHTRGYWDRITPDVFRFVSAAFT